MSLENLVSGVDRLTSSIEKARSKKEARVKAEREKKARMDLAETFAGTLEGQTAQGQMVTQGLSAGLLDPKDAIGKIPNFSKEEALMMLHAKAVEIKDPSERRIFLDKINQLSEKFNIMNERQAYYKTRGKLLAKEARPPEEPTSTVGAMPGSAPGGAPRGGQRRQGGGSSGASTDLQLTQGQENSDDGSVKIPYSVKLEDFAGEIRAFNESDPLYSDREKTPNPGESVDKQKWNAEEARAYRARLNAHMDLLLSQKTDLGAPGFEAYRQVIATRASEILENRGMKGFLTTSTRKEGITPQELVITEQVPMGILFTEKTKGKKGKEIIINKGLNKDAPAVQEAAKANRSPWARMKNMGKPLKPEAFMGKNSQKKEDEESRPIAADTNFYLGN